MTEKVRFITSSSYYFYRDRLHTLYLIIAIYVNEIFMLHTRPIYDTIEQPKVSDKFYKFFGGIFSMKNWDIGVILGIDADLNEAAKDIRELDLKTCQLNCWDVTKYTKENADIAKKALGDIRISSIWAGWPGPVAWDFWTAPLVDGLVPPEYRAIRIDALKKAADFAKMLGVTDITTHVGFIPENPADAEYIKIVAAIREVAVHCKNLGIFFNFETGQETPITLKRCIADIGTDNLGINLDPANLLMYGKANPLDSVQIFGEYVRSLHIKDGEYPTNGMQLGNETAVGEGQVDFKALLSKLDAVGFDGTLIIEREIEGAQQKADIIKARDIIRGLLAAM